MIPRFNLAKNPDWIKSIFGHLLMIWGPSFSWVPSRLCISSRPSFSTMPLQSLVRAMLGLFYQNSP